MDSQQRSAFIVSQAASANAEVAAMQAENNVALALGIDPVHTGEDFRNVIGVHDLWHNSVINYLVDD